MSETLDDLRNKITLQAGKIDGLYHAKEVVFDLASRALRDGDDSLAVSLRNASVSIGEVERVSKDTHERLVDSYDEMEKPEPTPRDFWDNVGEPRFVPRQKITTDRVEVYLIKSILYKPPCATIPGEWVYICKSMDGESETCVFLESQSLAAVDDK